MGLFQLILRGLFGNGPAPQHPTKRVSQSTQTADISPFYRDPFGDTAPGQPAVQPPLPHSLTGKCSVVDGDTIIIAHTTIRLAGIDAPELDHPYGKNAKWALIRLCKGHVIRAEFNGGLTYGRDVATCYLPDGRDLSAEMVKAGFAIDWAKYSGGKYRGYEHAGIRKKFWRADARQRGQWPPQPMG